MSFSIKPPQYIFPEIIKSLLRLALKNLFHLFIQASLNLKIGVWIVAIVIPEKIIDVNSWQSLLSHSSKQQGKRILIVVDKQVQHGSQFGETSCQHFEHIIIVHGC